MSDVLINNNLLYLVPLIFAMTMLIFSIVFSQRMKHEKIFINETSNFLYGLSFLKPFIWFINPDENDEKVKKTQVMLNKAGLHTRLNYRSFTSLQILLLMASIFAYGLLFFSLEAWMFLIGFLLNLPIELNAESIMKARLILAVITMALLLAPKTVIRLRAKRNEFLFSQDLPLVLLSVILKLRARRPISDIFFDLSRTDNRYREIFETGYRMYVRDKGEGYKYLRSQFEGTGFEDAIQVLEQMGDFAKEESIKVLENTLQQIIKTGQEQKRGKALAGNLASQFSMLLPFGGVILLGAVPIIVYALSMLDGGSIQP